MLTTGRARRRISAGLPEFLAPLVTSVVGSPYQFLHLSIRLHYLRADLVVGVIVPLEKGDDVDYVLEGASSCNVTCPGRVGQEGSAATAPAST
jgi:hypothetical protein